MLFQQFRERLQFGMAAQRARQMVERGEPDETIRQQIREVDQADIDAHASLHKFLADVDPLLTPGQQARLRIFQVMIEQRIRRMIDRARVP